MNFLSNIFQQRLRQKSLAFIFLRPYNDNSLTNDTNITHYTFQNVINILY